MKFKVVPFGVQHRDEMIYMILRAKEAVGHPPKINEDLLDINKYYFDRGDAFFVALDDSGRVIGCGGYSRIDATDEAFVHRLYVTPELKNCGIGTELLNAIEAAMLAKGIRVAKVHLGTPAEKWREAYNFYPKHGYREYAPGYMQKTLDEVLDAEGVALAARLLDDEDEFALAADGFSMSVRTRFYPDDIALPVNGTLYVSVRSGDYSGKAEMDIDYKWFNIFISRLAAIYKTLSGEARIAEPYGEQQFL